jgi:hypothetical protein
MAILESNEHSDIAGWLPNGRSFSIVDKQRFEQEVMPECFQDATKYVSLNRRLRRWKFACRHLSRFVINQGWTKVDCLWKSVARSRWLWQLPSNVCYRTIEKNQNIKNKIAMSSQQCTWLRTSDPWYSKHLHATCYFRAPHTEMSTITVLILLFLFHSLWSQLVHMIMTFTICNVLTRSNNVDCLSLCVTTTNPIRRPVGTTHP